MTLTREQELEAARNLEPDCTLGTGGTGKYTQECAVLTCTNTADPRWFARDVNDCAVMICDGHDPTPKADEVRIAPPDPAAQDLAARIVRIVRNGYSPTFSEVERVAHALLAGVSLAKEYAAELAELRDLADLVNDADIGALPPELLAVKQRWIAERHAKEVADFEAAIAAAWESIQRDGVLIARCRHCGFEALQFSDATIADHMKACTPGRQS